LSDGSSIENPKFLQKALAKLAKAQRHLSRKTKFSSNWKKQKAKVTKLHASVKNARKDFSHKASTAIVKNYNVVAVEDLCIANMVKNRHLSRAINDVGWGMFTDMIKYKANWQGKHFVKIDRFKATSQVCSACGERKPMPLSVRTYQCGGCGLEVDRDWNASLNIKAAGLAALSAS
jgi:putative transposase